MQTSAGFLFDFCVSFPKKLRDTEECIRYDDGVMKIISPERVFSSQKALVDGVAPVPWNSGRVAGWHLPGDAVYVGVAPDA